MKPNRFTFAIAAFLLAIGTLPLIAGEDWQPQAIGPFGTLNNRDNSFTIPATQAQDLLNVDLTPGGKSVKKRHGFGLAFSAAIATSPIHGVYNFFDANGNDVSLFFNDRLITSSVNGGTAATILSTGPFGATYQCTDSLGFAYCANSSRSSLIKTNGVTVSSISGVASTGTMVAACPAQLAMSGFAEAPSRIDFSATTDFTSWGTGPLGSSPAQFTINAPGAKVTHITYAFGRLMWFKDTSFGYILIGNQPSQSDWVVKTVAYDIGTNDNTSVYREGILYFRGKDSYIYAFDGSNYYRASREIAATIIASQTRSSNSWSQTSQSDFQNGLASPSYALSTSQTPGSVVLLSSSVIDTSSSDFGQATVLTNIDTQTVSGQFGLKWFVIDTFDDGNYTSNPTWTVGQGTGWGVVSNALNNNAGSVTGRDETIYTACDRSQGTWRVTGQIVSNANAGSGVWRMYFMAGAYDSGTFDSAYYVEINRTTGPSLYLIRTNGSGTPTTIANTAITDPGTTVHSVRATRDSSGNLNVYYDEVLKLTVQDSFVTQSTNFGLFGAGLCSGVSCQNATLQPAYNFDDIYFSPQIIGTAAISTGGTGSFESRVIDMGTAADAFGSFNSTATVPSGTSVSFFTASSSDGISFTSYVAQSTGTTINSAHNRYVKYKSNLFGGNAIFNWPRVQDVTISKISTGTFDSAVNNAPNLTSWDTFIPATQSSNATHAFFMRSSTGIFSTGSSTPSWSAVAANGTPAISTGSYFQVRDVIGPTGNGATGQLDSFVVNWFEGNAADKAYAVYFDDKILWSVSSGAGASTNNKILVYDILNQGWLLYDWAANGFFVRQNHLYFGSSQGGYIYKYGDIENDNGSPINAYWKSKDFFGGSPFSTQEIANISIAAKSVSNSSMTITYVTNGQASSSYTMSQYNPSGAFINQNKNLSAGTMGSEYNVSLGNNAADQPFEVFGIQVGIRSRSWIPTP